MKKFLLLIIALIPLMTRADDVNVSQMTTCYENLMYCEPACGIDRTFMYTHPLYRNLGAQLFLWKDLIFNHSRCAEYAFQVMPMYSESMNDRHAQAYFLMNDQSFLTVKGDFATTNTLSRDIRAEWLGLPSDFVGGFGVEPFQRQVAVWTEFKINCKAWSSNDFLNRLYVSIAVPFHRVENRIDIVETYSVSGTVYPTTIAEALNNPTLKYQRFGSQQKRNGVGEIMFKFGTNFLDYDGFLIGSYSMLVMPSSRAHNPEFVFSPYIGNDRHWGLGLGFISQFPLNCDTACKLISFFVEAETILFYRNFEHRVYDLKNGPWTRYILLANKDGRVNVPMSQVFSVKSRVRPYNMTEFSTGFRWESSGFNAELSYNLWLRGRERVKPHECFPSGWGVQGVGYFPATTIPRTASKSTIQYQADNDVDKEGNPKFVEITLDDVQLDSAAARGTINQRAQGALGYKGCVRDSEIFAGFGGFVETPLKYVNKPKVGDLQRWGVFAKFGMSL